MELLNANCAVEARARRLADRFRLREDFAQLRLRRDSVERLRRIGFRLRHSAPLRTAISPEMNSRSPARTAADAPVNSGGIGAMTCFFVLPSLASAMTLISIRELRHDEAGLLVAMMVVAGSTGKCFAQTSRKLGTSSWSRRYTCAFTTVSRSARPHLELVSSCAG